MVELLVETRKRHLGKLNKVMQNRGSGSGGENTEDERCRWSKVQEFAGIRKRALDYLWP